MPVLGFHFTWQLNVAENAEQSITEVTGNVSSAFFPTQTTSKISNSQRSTQVLLFYVIHPWVVRKSHAVHIKWKNYDDLGALLFEITHRINGIADAFLSMVPVKTLKSVLVLRAHSARKHAITQNGSSVPVLPEAMQDQAEQCWYSVLGDTDNWEGYSIHPHIFHSLSYGRIPSSNAYVAS